MNRPIASFIARWLPATGILLAGCSANGTGLLTGATPAGADAEPVAKAAAEPECRVPDNSNELADQILRLINFERLETGSVQLDRDLSVIAGTYACTLIDQDFFQHTNPHTEMGLADRLDGAGYTYTAVGENLAAGFWNAHEIVGAWMESPAHERILLDPAFGNAGIAVRYGGSYGVYCVLILADSAG